MTATGRSGFSFTPNESIAVLKVLKKSPEIGFPAIGVRSMTHAVLIGTFQPPLRSANLMVPLDKHIGMVESGWSEGNRLVRSILIKESRDSCGEPKDIRKIMYNLEVSLQMRKNEFKYHTKDQGILVAGFDDKGPHIYKVCSTGNAVHCRTVAIGRGTELIKEYLKRNVDDYSAFSYEEAIFHGFRALATTLKSDEMNSANLKIGIVGRELDFVVMDKDLVDYYLNQLETQTKLLPTFSGNVFDDSCTRNELYATNS